MGSKALWGVDAWVGGVLPYKATELKRIIFKSFSLLLFFFVIV